ncbi:MAG: hypothetical protein J6P81_08220, partial [Spirochaetales bacterium]|nr:hypothetical protein [Spirochaetales bacterium]
MNTEMWILKPKDDVNDERNRRISYHNPDINLDVDRQLLLIISLVFQVHGVAFSINQLLIMEATFLL